MMSRLFHSKKLSEFRRDESGTALVEFAILMPMMLVLFAVIIEGGRLMWAYQNVNAGVRDATRYLARVAPKDMCSGGTAVSTYTTKAEEIVRNRIDGTSPFPSGISVNSVSLSLNCVAGTYRVSPAPVIQVSANLSVTFPFAGVFSLVGGNLQNVNTVISDQSRVFGA